MVKSMYSGVAGLKAHQSKMDVIGNNIANVNTWGYKTMDTSFKESIYSMVTSGSGGSTADGGYGGVNPSVVGYGSMVSTIASNFTSGNQVPTGKNLDVYIDGTAFFAVGPMYGDGEAKSPADVFMSRVGDFNIVNGYLVDGNGRYVYGSTMTKGGEVHNPTSTVTSTDKILKLGLPDNALKFNGRNVKYSEYDNYNCGDGKMNSYVYRANSYTSVDPKSDPALAFFIGTTAPDAADVKAAVDTFNASATGTVRYVVATGDPTKVIRIDLTTAKDPSDPANATANNDLKGYITGGNWNADSIKDAVDAYNQAASTASPANDNRYMINPKDPTQVVAYSVATASEVDPMNPAASDELGKELKSYMSPTTADIKKAVEDYNASFYGQAPTENNKYRYAVDTNNPRRVIKMERQTALNETNVDIPLPETQVTKDADGRTVTITYEATGTPGEAKQITTVVTPPDEDSVSEGPQFDDGRFTFDPETGSYTMMENVGSLKPIKIPSTCTYYDDKGELQTETNVVFSTFTIEKNGMIYGTSEKTKEVYLLGCVGLVNVSNPGGMTKTDGPYYQLSAASGEGTIVQPGGMTGSLTSGYLESANVDIATEFSSMITTQRGFQANSKIITVTDEMLQELVNMKR